MRNRDLVHGRTWSAERQRRCRIGAAAAATWCLAAAGPATAIPVMADPNLFSVELYADFAPLGGNLKAFDLLLTGGEQGFQAGLYVTSGPTGDTRSDRVVRIDGPGLVTPVKSGLVSNEGAVFSQGSYPPGMLIAIPRQQRIVQLLPDGTMNTFASGFTAPFGPTGIVFGLDGALYASDNSSHYLVRIDSAGVVTPFAAIDDSNPKGPAVSAFTSPFGGGYYVGTFTAPGIDPLGAGMIYKASPDGSSVTEFASGFDGLELLAFGPGDVFGRDLFAPQTAGAPNADGAIFTVDPAGKVVPFMTQVDATNVAFDTEGVLGGGMFVGDINDAQGPGKIWHVTAQPQWKADADGVWFDPGNWIGPVPNAPDSVANFGYAISAPRIVQLSGPAVVGTLHFNNADSYSIVGNIPLTMDVAAGMAGMEVVKGSHTVLCPVILADNLSMTVGPSNGVLALLAQLVMNDHDLIKNGPGVLTVRNVLTAGILNIGGGTVKVLPDGTNLGTSKVGALSIAGGIDAWMSTLDLGNNDMVLDYSGPSPLATVGNLIKNGYAGGAWNGRGIASSIAAGVIPPAPKTALGFAENSVLGYVSFSGVGVDATSVLIKYTYSGDANLDGQVDISDLGRLATAWQTGGVWISGDFNYDEFVDISDLGLLATNWQQGVGNPLGPSFDQALASLGLPGATVPEPAGLALAAMGAMLLARCRRRQGR